MNMNFGKWRLEGKLILISLVSGIVLFAVLLLISNLEFVKESSNTFDRDGLFLNIVASIGLAVACYGVMICVEDYLSHCSDKTEGRKFICKTLLRYFLPLVVLFIVAFVVCGIYGVNIFGELIILGTIYFVITFPKFVNKHLPEE